MPARTKVTAAAPEAPGLMTNEQFRITPFPAAGYPACPDHTEKGPLWQLLDVERNTGIQITESFAMWPGSSVSGLYFAHPQSRYFPVGKIDREQIEDCRARKGMSLDEAERWLSPALNYDPDAEGEAEPQAIAV